MDATRSKVIPERFLDPVTFNLMTDPVVCSDGRTYDSFTAAKLNRSPFTREPLSVLVDNVHLRGELLENYPARASAYAALQNARKNFHLSLPNLPRAGFQIREVQYPNGDVYEGTVQGQDPHGYGVYKRPDGVRYDGQFWHGQLHGRGQHQSLTEYYIGDYRNNKRVGKGLIRFEDGRIYEGDVREKAHGKGRLIFLSGAVYDGEFENGNCHGEGTLSFPSGSKLTGTFKNGRPQFGRFDWPDGSSYCGFCEFGPRSGQYTSAEGVSCLATFDMHSNDIIVYEGQNEHQSQPEPSTSINEPVLPETLTSSQ